MSFKADVLPFFKACDGSKSVKLIAIKIDKMALDAQNII